MRQGKLIRSGALVTAGGGWPESFAMTKILTYLERPESDSCVPHDRLICRKEHAGQKLALVQKLKAEVA